MDNESCTINELLTQLNRTSVESTNYCSSFTSPLAQEIVRSEGVTAMTHNTHKFILWFFIFLWFSKFCAAPFLNPLGEARIAASSSYIYSLTFFLYIWVISSSFLTFIHHLSKRNEIIAAALFFPMFFSTIGLLLVGRFGIRVSYYLWRRGKFICEVMNKNQYLGDIAKENDRIGNSKLIRFHRPFRKLVNSSAIISTLLSFLYAHCWSQTLSVFTIDERDGAGFICRAIFSPLQGKEDDIRGTDEKTIWLLWVSAVLVVLIKFIIDEFSGVHYFKRSSKCFDNHMSIITRECNSPNGCNESFFVSEEMNDDMNSYAQTETKSALFLRPQDGPKDTLPMVPWYSLIAARSIFDVLVQLKVFLGRFDARSMQSALHNNIVPVGCTNDGIEDGIERLKRKYHGCIFEYDLVESKTKDGFWFDFTADCGDGFNSSYQVARMLAQQNILPIGNNNKKLPRGDFLLVGGDLAYPSPSEENYNNRFFRVFEDAMPPPSSFRREKISIKKPDLPVRGWKNCFNIIDIERKGKDKEDLQRYKGPCTFTIPGNHDWFDGLATYTRLILNRDWLGGWLLPQERSYFALKLPHGWWVLGLDHALAKDIDINQFKFFADVAASMNSSDAVIIVSHAPHWVTDFDENLMKGNDQSERNVRELMNTHLAGKVRLRLAGDIHHYTRHVPSSAEGKKISRSLSFDSRKTENGCVNQIFEPLTEENRPELVVSGGGGAFLHATHCYAKNIKVGDKEVNYTRVCAYPNEKVSYYLGWLNMWYFRSRNWRCDIVWAIAYLGVAYSMFPLCGIYANFLAVHEKNGNIFIFPWLVKIIIGLLYRIVTSEKVSFVFVSLIMTLSFMTTSDRKLSPSLRFFLSFTHGAGHVIAALVSLVFLQCIIEWIIDEGIVKVTSDDSSGTIDLASSLYDEYITHFSPIFKNFTHINTTNTSHSHQSWVISSFTHGTSIYELITYSWKLMCSEIPLIETTLQIFDLPGGLAQRHNDMCTILCTEDVECLLSHNPAKYYTIERYIFAPYLVAVSLYFSILVVPFAAGIYGGWLTLALNIFNAQGEEAFSSLRLQHWKNFLKLHININGDLEMFAIGLHRVPTQWVKDPLFTYNEEGVPSWAWNTPSKWKPVQDKSEKFSPEVIDHTYIKKRRATHLQSKIKRL